LSFVQLNIYSKK